MADDTLLSEAPGSLLHSQFSGHGTPKKSKNQQGFATGKPDPIRELSNYRLKWKLRDARKVKAKANRLRSRFNKLQEWVCSLHDPCLRRACESTGLAAKNFNYTAQPKLVIANPKLVFELNTGCEPFASFTDCGEAMETCIAMRAYGFPAAFVMQRDRSK